MNIVKTFNNANALAALKIFPMQKIKLLRLKNYTSPAPDSNRGYSLNHSAYMG